MKKIGRRLAALTLALLMTAQLGQTARASWALGSELVERSVTLAENLVLTAQSLWSASKSDLRTEHYITYTPNSDSAVRPVVYSGAYAASVNPVTTAVTAWENHGYRVLAALNGGFFNSDGTVVGMLMTDGVVRSLDVENYSMVGFTDDGEVFIDESWPTRAAAWQAGDGTERSFPVWGFNAYRHSGYLNGLFLYNGDFASKVHSGGENVSVILRPVEEGAHIAMNGSLTLEVVSVADTTAGDLFNGVLPMGCYMLYAEDHDNAALLDSLRELTPGRQVTISVGGVSEQWARAQYGVSALYTLLREGEIVTGLPDTANPYTAIGLKEDGSVVFYTIDGRQRGYSIGATYAQVAQRLQELGCVTAVALDGGASTTMKAHLPGGAACELVNRPSSAERKINNSILLVTPKSEPTGELAGFHLSSSTQVVLAGSDLPVSASAYDTMGHPLSGENPRWEATGGTINWDGRSVVYTAGSEAGTYAISASEGSDPLPVRVVDTLSYLSIKRNGAAVSTLTVGAETVTNLTASGTWWNLPVSMGNQDVTWTADPAIGTIDAQGQFTAGHDSAAGRITAQAGGKTVVIPVTVTRSDPFTDIAGHWSAEYIVKLFDLGITNGYAQPDGTSVFRPSGQLTRGELLAFLSRLLEVDVSLYEDVELPFADAEKIPGWVLPDVKAMYALGVFTGSDQSGVLYANVGSNITREAAMTMLGRVLTASESCDLSGFVDAARVSSWAQPYVQTLVSLGIVNGNNGQLLPRSNITRAEAAKLLVLIRDLERISLTPEGSEEPVEPDIPENPDEPAPTEPGPEESEPSEAPDTPENPDGSESSGPTEPVEPPESSGAEPALPGEEP